MKIEKLQKASELIQRKQERIRHENEAIQLRLLEIDEIVMKEWKKRCVFLQILHALNVIAATVFSFFFIYCL
jgi:hypothetical protein